MKTCLNSKREVVLEKRYHYPYDSVMNGSVCFNCTLYDSFILMCIVKCPYISWCICNSSYKFDTPIIVAHFYSVVMRDGQTTL